MNKVGLNKNIAFVCIVWVEFSKCLIGNNVIEIRNEVKVGMTKGKSA